MKKLLLVAAASFALNSCKKEEKDNSDKTRQPQTETTKSTSDSAFITAPPNDSEIKVVPLDEHADVGKTIFTYNGNTIISFNTVSQKGNVNINGKNYPLTQLNFSESSYEISGENIQISAEEGAFEDMKSDCMYGSFAEVAVTADGKRTILKNVKVQDCPKY